MDEFFRGVETLREVGRQVMRMEFEDEPSGFGCQISLGNQHFLCFALGRTPLALDENCRSVLTTFTIPKLKNARRSSRSEKAAVSRPQNARHGPF
jgi:hypothetical protein